MRCIFALRIDPATFVAWWAQVDSNHRPRAYQARALTTWAMSPFSFLDVSLVYSRSRFFLPMVEMKGIEPLTPCLQGRCSPSWATPPIVRFLRQSLAFLWLYGHSKLNNNRLILKSLYTLSPSVKNFFGFGLFPNYELSVTPLLLLTFSIERRWSSRTFRYGYLVTT